MRRVRVPLQSGARSGADNGAVDRNDLGVRRLRGTDPDLAKIVEQINAASMEIDEPLTLHSLTEFLADDRNIYLTVHADGRLAGALHAIGHVHPAGRRYVCVDEVDTDEAFRRQGVASAMLKAAREIARGTHGGARGLARCRRRQRCRACPLSLPGGSRGRARRHLHLRDRPGAPQRRRRLDGLDTRRMSEAGQGSATDVRLAPRQIRDFASSLETWPRIGDYCGNYASRWNLA